MSRTRDSQRWSVLTMAVHRGIRGTAECTLSFRRVDGRTVFDRKLRWGRIDVPPGSPASADPIIAAAWALWTLSSESERVLVHRLWADLAEGPPCPQGGSGGA